jgi:hypothetical protein
MKPAQNGKGGTTRDLYRRKKEGTIPRKGSKHPLQANERIQIYSTLKDIAELAGTTRNALNVAKVHGEIDPGDFKSVVSFLTRRVLDNRLTGDLFTPAARIAKRMKGNKSRAYVLKKQPKR